MSHRSRGPIRLLAVSFLFTASMAIGAGGALAVTADPDSRPGAGATVSPTPLSEERPTCPPTQSESAAPAPKVDSTPAPSAESQPIQTPTASATPTATPLKKDGAPLASTGSNVGPIVGVVAVALVIGGVLFFVARRRAATH